MTAVPLLPAILAIALSGALLGFGLLLTLLKHRHDPEGLKKVPLRASFIGWGALAALMLVGNFALSNVQANDAAYANRTKNAQMEMIAQYSLEPTLHGPLDDILRGTPDLLAGDQANQLNRGERITLHTGSGKPATLQLFGDGKNIVPVLIYDGKPVTEAMTPFADKAVNNAGYPQVFLLPSLPSRT